MLRPSISKAVRPKIVFSGIQPTGVPHLGNYVGALRQWVDLQDLEPATKLIYSIVDLHAITTPQPPDLLRKRKRETLAALLAMGINPERCTLFYQSAIPAHSELMWILSCTASVGYLSRMTQWKQKLHMSATSTLQDKHVASQLKLGLFSYPVLQAADILVHRATHVPVGHDQQQHLEFARECVTNFNNAHGSHLVQPETITREYSILLAAKVYFPKLTRKFDIAPIHRIMSLSEPESKMSKSHPSDRSRILITDSADEIRKKISAALTDSLPGIAYDVANRPGFSNLLQILAVFDPQGRDPVQLAQAYGDVGPKRFKEMVSNAVVDGLAGIRDRFEDIVTKRQTFLDDVEAEGSLKARRSAEETMKLVRDAVGL